VEYPGHRSSQGHGLPLSLDYRRAAAERIIASRPHLSDRAIGQAAGLAAKTVAAIRKLSVDHVPQSSARVGRDGRVRPLDSGEGRRRAAELLLSQPEASLRDVARVAGISPATVLNVRNRLARGEPPAPQKPGTAQACAPAARPRPAARPGSRPDPAATVAKLLRDPSLRSNHQGKEMLRLLHINAVSADQLPDVAATVPPHCVTTVGQLACQYARMWQDFAQKLNARARIIDPPAASR
jgi:hypothetical protein